MKENRIVELVEELKNNLKSYDVIDIEGTRLDVVKWATIIILIDKLKKDIQTEMKKYMRLPNTLSKNIEENYIRKSMIEERIKEIREKSCLTCENNKDFLGSCLNCHVEQRIKGIQSLIESVFIKLKEESDETNTEMD